MFCRRQMERNPNDADDIDYSCKVYSGIELLTLSEKCHYSKGTDALRIPKTNKNHLSLWMIAIFLQERKFQLNMQKVTFVKSICECSDSVSANSTEHWTVMLVSQARKARMRRLELWDSWNNLSTIISAAAFWNKLNNGWVLCVQNTKLEFSIHVSN